MNPPPQRSTGAVTDSSGGSTADVRTSAGRDPVLDNARAVLIALVVLGHIHGEVPGTLSKVVSVWIYSFHMPAFIFICGYLARTYRSAPHQVARIVTGLLAPYLIFQTLHAVIRAITLGNGFSVQYLKPSWTMWFLLALAMWRLVTPVLKILRWPLITAVLLSVLAPLMDNLDQTLTLARFFSLMPFFVAGLLARPEHLAMLRARGMRWLGAGVLVAAFAAALLLHDQTRKGMFTFDTSYVDQVWDVGTGIAVRILALACGALGTAAVLAVVPARRRWWTFVGERTMYVYLLHAVLINCVRHLEWSETWGTVPFVLVVVPLIAVALTLLLASPPVVAATRWIVEPRLADALVDEGRPTAGRTQDSSARRRSGSR